MTALTSKLSNNKISSKSHAIIAGSSLLIMTVVAIFSYGFVFNSLVSKTSALDTIENIRISPDLFFYGIIGWFVIIITDIAVSLSLFGYFKSSDSKLSAAAGLIRLVYTAILSVAVYYLYQSGSAIINTDITISTLSSSEALKMTAGISKFQSIWSFGLIVFGFHLMILALASYKKINFPKVLSLLILLAGFSYTLVHFMHTFLPMLNSYTLLVEVVLSIPMTLAELSLAIWLITKGRKVSN